MANQDPLRSCPSCGGPVTKGLGLRDYESWLPKGLLPGRVSGSDVDFMLEQAQTGRILVHEYKEGGKPLGLGQRLLLKGLISKGIDVWVIWEKGDGSLLGGEMDATGEVRFTQEMTKAELAAKVKGWWYDGLTP